MPTPTEHAEFKGLTDWVEVFRAGRQTDSQGRTQTFTRGDLDEIASNIRAEAPPPHVITHKELYSPFRYGDVVEGKRDGDALLIRSANIEPQFQKLVAERRLPDRSVRLSRSPNGLSLAHVAWLGAEPPAVENMAPVQFAAATDNVFDFNFSDVRSTGVLARMMRRTREFLIDQFSQEVADRVMPDWEVEAAESAHVEARTEDDPESAPSFTAPAAPAAPEGEPDMSTNDETVSKSDYEQAQKENAELKTQLAARAHEARTSEFRSVVKDAIDAGRVTPAQTEGMAEFMATLSGADDALFEFSAGEKVAKKSPATWFSDFLNGLGKQVDLDESDAGSELDTAQNVEFASQPGYQVNSEKLAVHNKALDYQAKNPGTDYLTAVNAVS